MGKGQTEGPSFTVGLLIMVLMLAAIIGAWWIIAKQSVDARALVTYDRFLDYYQKCKSFGNVRCNCGVFDYSLLPAFHPERTDNYALAVESGNGKSNGYVMLMKGDEVLQKRIFKDAFCQKSLRFFSQGTGNQLVIYQSSKVGSCAFRNLTNFYPESVQLRWFEDISNGNINCGESKGEYVWRIGVHEAFGIEERDRKRYQSFGTAERIVNEISMQLHDKGFVSSNVRLIPWQKDNLLAGPIRESRDEVDWEAFYDGIGFDSFDKIWEDELNEIDSFEDSYTLFVGYAFNGYPIPKLVIDPGRIIDTVWIITGGGVGKRIGELIKAELDSLNGSYFNDGKEVDKESGNLFNANVFVTEKDSVVNIVHLNFIDYDILNLGESQTINAVVAGIRKFYDEKRTSGNTEGSKGATDATDDSEPLIPSGS